MNVAIIVTYNPDWSHVELMAKELLIAQLKVIVFDNTPGGLHCIDHPGLYVLRTGENLGLGAAFNRSLDFCIDKIKNVENVMFFDQDSTFTHKDVSKLFSEYYALQTLNIPVGVLGAQAIMPNNKPYPFKIVNDYPNIEGFEQAWFVMSSFSIVSIGVINNIGFFKDELFIDLVDSEFSFRCRQNNLLNLISKNTQFVHVVGESRKEFLGRSFSISAPLRNYYQVRNAIIVGMENGLFIYIIRTISLRFTQTILSGIHGGEFTKRLKYFFRGLMDGLLNRSGPYK
jgi:rhamnosyltransferase